MVLCSENNLDANFFFLMLDMACLKFYINTEKSIDGKIKRKKKKLN